MSAESRGTLKVNSQQPLQDLKVPGCGSTMIWLLIKIVPSITITLTASEFAGKGAARTEPAIEATRETKTTLNNIVDF